MTLLAADRAACTDTSGSGRVNWSWDATVTEQLTGGRAREWILHVGDSFADVARSHWAYRFIETIFHNRVTPGCNADPFNYCPGSTLTRAEMAVLLTATFHLQLHE